MQKTLYGDVKPKDLPKNKILDVILEEGDWIAGNPNLVEKIVQLKEMKLLNEQNANNNQLKSSGKRNYVYNDYHTKSTNNGYSRNFGGTFYTR